MNRRTFIKYLSCAPIALATLLTSRPTSSVVRKKTPVGTPYLSNGKWYVERRGFWGIEIEELGQKYPDCLERNDFRWTEAIFPNKWHAYYNSPQEEKEDMTKALRKALKNHKFPKYI